MTVVEKKFKARNETLALRTLIFLGAGAMVKFRNLSNSPKVAGTL